MGHLASYLDRNFDFGGKIAEQGGGQLDGCSGPAGVANWSDPGPLLEEGGVTHLEPERTQNPG